MCNQEWKICIIANNCYSVRKKKSTSERVINYFVTFKWKQTEYIKLLYKQKITWPNKIDFKKIRLSDKTINISLRAGCTHSHIMPHIPGVGIHKRKIHCLKSGVTNPTFLRGWGLQLTSALLVLIPIWLIWVISHVIMVVII